MHASRSTTDLHARVTAELPFSLTLPSGMYFLKLPSSNAALPFIVKAAPYWVLGFEANPTAPLVLQHPRQYGIATNPNEDTARIVEWVAHSDLDRAVMLPAGTLLEMRIWFMDKSFTKDVAAWADAHETRRLIIFLINNFLSRYQVACGFTPASGKVGSVSEIDLRHLSVRLFDGDVPHSPGYALVPALPAQPKPQLPDWPPDASVRLEATLRIPAVPLWLDLAHEAHSLLYRGRNEQSIVGWIQALEVALDQIAGHLKLQLSRRGTIEEHVAELLQKLQLEPLSDDLRSRLVSARQLRNRIVHEGLRLTFADSQAEIIAATVIRALAILEQCAVQVRNDTN